MPNMTANSQSCLLTHDLKPLTNPTMNQYKTITRVPHISEPFVDWYDAETEEQARAIWEADRQTYGLPADASVKFEKQ